ncbi:thioredoxin family protein [Thermodesulfobacteriota bacterium]
MPENAITQIRVGKHPAGIIGLKPVLEAVSNECKGMSDEDIKGELLKRLSLKNYFTKNAKEEYGQAFLREYKKFVGEPFEGTDRDGIEIKVLGPGCPQCEKLEQDLMAVMSELNIAAGLEHVRDIAEIGSYGVMGSPALIINGQVKAVGSVPPKIRIKEWLIDANKNTVV